MEIVRRIKMWVKTESENYTNIANAIREMNRVSTQYTPAQMPEKIQNLLVARQIGKVTPNSTVQVCDNSSGTKAKSFTVSLQFSNIYEGSLLTIFFAEAWDGSSPTGNVSALIRKSSNAIISEEKSGEFQNGTRGGSSNWPQYNAVISVPAGASRTVSVVGYPLRYK